MKNSKTLFTAIAVCAVVSSALAFKAINPNVYETDPTLQTCTKKTTYKTVPTGGTIITGQYSTVLDNTQPCPQQNLRVVTDL